MKIYHYTTIEGLVSILYNRTIKFSRLDTVDDLDEGKIVFNGTPLSHIYFASCWSLDSNESIPMWKLYTKDGVGVRIGIDSETIFDNLIEQISEEDCQKNDVIKEFLDIIGNKHYLDTLTITKSPVDYVHNPIDKIQEAIVPYSERCEDFKINNQVVGFTKDVSWSFQKEYRFLKMILPRDHKTINLHPGDSFNMGWKETYKLLMNGKDPEKAPGIPLKAIYEHVGKNAFSNLEIIIGPNCKKEHKFIVTAICRQLGLKPIISLSCLTGRIRFK